MPHRQASWIAVAAWLHRQCLHLAPRRFRRQYAAEAAETFGQFIGDIRQERGTPAAMAAALAAIGDAATTAGRERAADARHAVLSGMWIDLARAPRVYWRSPFIAAAITVILAVAAGPVVALVTVLYQGVLAPLPYPDADRLVVVTHTSQYGRNFYLPGWSVEDYRQVASFAQMSGVRPLGNRVTFNGEPQVVATFQVTSGALSMLGVRFAAGRDLRPEDSPEDVVVVARGFAVAHFGSADAAIGQRLTLVRSTPTIVGVLDSQPRLPGGRALPASLFTLHPIAERLDLARRDRSTQAIVIARMRDGVTIEQAEAEVRSAAAGVRAVHGGDDVEAALEPLEIIVSGPTRVPLLLLFAAIGVLFLIAASSLASLVLARAAARVPDIVLRRSLGATRWRLTRVWLVEGLLLAVPGIALGSWSAIVLLRVARAAVPDGMIPGLATTTPTFVWTSAGVLLLLTATLFTIAPVVAGVLKASATSSLQSSHIAGLRRVRAQNLLIVGQVSLGVVLVTASLWLAMGLYRTLSRPVGFEPDGLVMVAVESPRDSTRDMNVVASAHERLSSRFGAGSVAAASSMPGVNADRVGTPRVRADQDVRAEETRLSLARFLVSPNYFALLGIPLIEGRSFTADEERTPGSAIVVSRTFAARWFPEGAMGRHVSFTGKDRRAIVGVAEDVHAATVASDASEPAFYLPATDNFLSGAINAFLIRTTRPVADVRAEAQHIFHDLDPSATLLVLSARDAMAYPLTPRITAQRAVIGLALLALALAVINVYALSAFSVVQRAHEIGIRIALGATSTDTLRLVMRRSVVWITCGLVAGTAATIWLARPALGSQLAGLPTDESWLLAVAFAAVSVVAIVASWLPARRATRIDPAVALRAE